MESIITGRELSRDEVERVWELDRAEAGQNVYHLVNGHLMLRPEQWEISGWPADEAARYTPLLLDCFDRGGRFHGLFDDLRLIGVAVLDSKLIGRRRDLVQLKFMHVSRAYRGRGLGHRLFEWASAQARAQGAHGLYISATPSENTVDFYLGLGCFPTREPDPELLALEPDDIHMECPL